MAGLFARTLPIERVPNGKATLASSYVANLVAPHGSATRWTYTVPSNTATEIESCLGLWARDAAAAPAGLVTASIAQSGFGGILRTDGSDNTVDVGHIGMLARPGFLAAGESITGTTADASVGGTVRYNVVARYREFSV